MVIEAGSTLAAAGATFRLSQIAHELSSVDEQTQDLLDSTKHVSSNLKSARTMRRQKSQFLSTDEKKWVDGVLEDTDRCLRDFATLVEPARVDLQTGSGRVSLLNRGLWVFRDGPKVATSLARLNLTSQSLNSAITILCNKGSMVNSIRIEGTIVNTSRPQSLISKDSKQSLPTYSESEFLNRNRNRISRSKSDMKLAVDIKPQTPPPQAQVKSFLPAFSFETTADKEPEDPFVAELEAIQAPVKHVSVPTPTVTVTEVSGTPISEIPRTNTSNDAQTSPTLVCLDARVPYMPPARPSPIPIQQQSWGHLPPCLRAGPVRKDENLPMVVDLETPGFGGSQPHLRPTPSAVSDLRSQRSVSSLRSMSSESEVRPKPDPSALPVRVKSRGRAWLESQSGL